MHKHLIPTLLCDFYKISHKNQYPEGTELVYSTWTPRTSRIGRINKVVAFGFQAFVKKFLIDFFDENFFERSKEEVVGEYKRMLKHTLLVEDPDATHIEELHDLGYLPLEVKAVPEGTLVPIRVPMMTIENTDPRFFWLTNYIETLASCELWQAATSATIAHEFKKLLDKYSMETVGNTEFVQFQGHDFSMRGMSSLHSAMLSGAGHLLSFAGTDTIPAIMFAEHYYNANIENELVGTSIPATEHSVQCAYGDDFAYFERMISEVVPTGFVSIVSDGYDFWKVISDVIPALKDRIMKREGRTVIRPDSGDPVKIICGDPDGATELEKKGAVEALWDIFGGTVTEQGYKVLDEHIGLIYGDAITLDRAEQICEGLKQKGFASINSVFGVGSFTYQFNTRDTFGFALKSTLCRINGQEVEIFKDPKTDNGVKKSQKGRVAVRNNDGVISVEDQLTVEQAEMNNMLEPIFRDGKLLREQSFGEIRSTLNED